MPKTLIIMRHAKSSWTTDDADFHRPLAGRGRRDAAAAADYLQRAGVVPDLVLCSAATRARQTWESLAAGGVDAGVVTYSDDLYHSDSDDVLAVLRTLPDTVETVMVIGHQPTLGYLVSDVCAGDPRGQLAAGLPTSAIAVLSFDGPWSGLERRSAALVTVEIPRG